MQVLYMIVSLSANHMVYKSENYIKNIQLDLGRYPRRNLTALKMNFPHSKNFHYTHSS